jgi:hypothetical protein
MSFFDMTFKNFFGLTWKGPTRQVTDRVTYDESVYFCSSSRDEHILIVIEIAAKSSSSGKAVSCGWTAFRPFLSNTESNKRCVI